MRSLVLLTALLLSPAAFSAPKPTLPASSLAPKDRVVELLKSPSCGCCEGWAEHMRKAGFTVKVHPTDAMPQKKDALGVPMAGRSCHTSTIGNKVFEGHVPAKDIADFMKAPPKGAKGLAVPGMPMGSPGMDGPGMGKQAYEVKVIRTKAQLSETYRTH